MKKFLFFALGLFAFWKIFSFFFISYTSDGRCGHIGWNHSENDNSLCDLEYKIKDQPTGEIIVENACFYFISREPWKRTFLDINSQIELQQLIGKKIKITEGEVRESGDWNCGQEKNLNEQYGHELTVKINKVEIVE
jgi:hypothetical protein